MIQELQNGDYIILGQSQFVNGPLVRPNVWISRLTSTGEFLWQKTYGDNTLYVEPKDIEQTPDGGFIVGASTSSFGVGLRDFWIFKLDGDGQILWEKTYGTGESELLAAITVTDDGNYLATGVMSANGSSDAWLLKLDNSGNIIWQKTFGGDFDEAGVDVLPASDGGYLLAATTRSFVTYPDFRHVWLLKLSTDGTVVWQKTYRISESLFKYSIDYKNSTDSYVLAVYADSAVIWVFEVDNTGNIVWQKTHDFFSDDILDIDATNDGGIVMAGIGPSSSSLIQAWVVKVTSDGDIADCTAIETGNGISFVTNDVGVNTNVTGLSAFTPVITQSYSVTSTLVSSEQVCPTVPIVTPTPVTPTPIPALTPRAYLPLIIRN